MPTTYIKKILEATVYDVAHETPIQKMDSMSETLGNTVLVKREDLQPVHSFKLRGAYNKISKIPPAASTVSWRLRPETTPRALPWRPRHHHHAHHHAEH